MYIHVYGKFLFYYFYYRVGATAKSDLNFGEVSFMANLSLIKSDITSSMEKVL